jgi:hypothetical protein
MREYNNDAPFNCRVTGEPWYVTVFLVTQESDVEVAFNGISSDAAKSIYPQEDKWAAEPVCTRKRMQKGTKKGLPARTDSQ